MLCFVSSASTIVCLSTSKEKVMKALLNNFNGSSHLQGSNSSIYCQHTEAKQQERSADKAKLVRYVLLSKTYFG